MPSLQAPEQINSLPLPSGNGIEISHFFSSTNLFSPLHQKYMFIREHLQDMRKQKGKN